MNKLRHINKMASLYRHATLLSGISHNLFICILVSLALPTRERAGAAVYGGRAADGERRLTKEYHLRQGALRGLIVQPGRQNELQSVEMFLGIPYAAPPVGNLRFMPPVTAVPWSGVRNATEFAPVCPQMLPAVHKGNPPSHGRQQYMSRLLPFLKNESEDCLYLNIYVPNQEHKPKKMPVLVFIHGDSFEWSSGNPYDGRVLASYGNVMVVTINYRLGILGFMKPSLTDHAYGNNGLLDQLAALQWIKDNIYDLNGDPDSVTLMGHGTGAACVHYHMISPISEGLFHRAILMSGSALSDWALTESPAQYTVQVAQHLHCNVTNQNIMACMQNRRLADIKKVQILAQKFATRLGPIVAGAFILNEPAKTIESYPNIFSKYELLSGVTELESYHEFGVIALAHGVLETERDELLAQYAQLRYHAAPEHAVRDILDKYAPSHKDPQSWSVYENRELVLDALSDARTVAPQLLAARQHCVANARSYFYVFGHNSEHTDYAALRKSVHGEELPYVLGVPMGGARTHLHQEYTAKERLLSEVLMRLWTNFIKGGTPNADRKEQYLTLNSEDWSLYDIDWPEFNIQHQSFLRLDVPPSNFVRSFYRANYTKFWNEVLPDKMRNYAVSPLFEYGPVPTTARSRTPFPTAAHERHAWKPPLPQGPHLPPPTYGRPRPYVPHPPTTNADDIYKVIKSIKKPSDFKEDQMKREDFHSTRKPKINPQGEQPIKTSSATIGTMIGIGCIFLIVNIFIFAALYFKKRRLHAREQELKRDHLNGDVLEPNDGFSKPKENNTFEKLKISCNAIKTMHWNKSNRSIDPHTKNKIESLKTPKSDDSGGFGQRFKLRRHLSTSTIDAQTKVRDWIANEIINRCSPPITRKIDVEPQNMLSQQKVYAQSADLINKTNIVMTHSKESMNISLHDEQNSTLSTRNKRNKTRTSEKTTSTSAHESLSTIGHSKDGIRKSHKSPKSKSNDSITNSESTRSNKVSVAIDATPAARTSAILRQQPIELSKSLEIVENISVNDNMEAKILKRSKTENDFIDQITKPEILNKDGETFTSIVNLSLKDKLLQKPIPVVDIVRISHKHSVSDPVKDLNYDAIVQYTDFPDIPPPTIFRNDINVTSQDESKQIAPLSAAEALLTIKRRNFPKVLPDLPKSFSDSQKRLSLQPNSFQSFRSYLNTDPKDHLSTSKVPPLPPPRTTSTLDRRVGYKNIKTSGTSSFDSGKMSFGSICENKISNNEDYSNIDAIASMLSEIKSTSSTNVSPNIFFSGKKDPPTQETHSREFPKVIIAANDIPNVRQPKIIIKQTKSIADIQKNAPRVRLPENFHSICGESSGSVSTPSTISDCDFQYDEFEDNFSDAKLIEALVGGIDTTFDSKGPDNSFEKKLEVVPVKVNTTPVQSPKIYEQFKYCTDDLLPDASDLEKTAQIKQKFSLNKLKNRSDSINQPPEKAVNLKDKKISKTATFLSKTNKDRTNSIISKLPKQKTDTKKKIPLEHSYSGSSNDTETSTGTVKKVEIKK